MGVGLRIGPNLMRTAWKPFLVCCALITGTLGGVTLQAGTAAAATWSIAPSPNASSSGSTSGQLDAVTCVSATYCTAVGSSIGPYGYNPTLVESWDGSTWSIVPSPNVSSSSASVLSGVACVSPTNCTAVGSSYYFDGTNTIYQTLVESWDGSTWSIVPSPNVSGIPDSVLKGVACVSATNCTAVGHDETQTLVEAWDGSTWSIVPSPNVSAGIAPQNQLDAVTCVSATNCTAVGSSYYFDGFSGEVRTLVEVWDGSTWSVVPSANQYGSFTDRLYGVSCVSASNCTAVGYSYLWSNKNQALVEVWDGSTWSVVPIPDLNSDPSLNGVSCVSSTNCTAVGIDYAYSETLLLAWDGSTWRVVQSGIPGGSLGGVSCTSSTGSSTCTAVGSSGGQTLVEAQTRATPVVSWTPAPITYGQYLSGSQLDATSSTPGMFAYSPPLGTRLSAGSQTLSATFTPTDKADYSSVAAIATLQVAQVTPVVTWKKPKTIIYGTALSTVQLRATTSVPGNFSYTPMAGTVISAGVDKLSAMFTPLDTTDYATVTSTTTITVNQAKSTTTLSAPSSLKVGSEDTGTFSASVSGPPGMVPIGVVTVSSGLGVICSITLNASGAGSCSPSANQLKAKSYSIKASYSGSGNLKASKSAASHLTVSG